MTQQLHDVLLYPHFRLGIERGSRLVQNDHRRVFQERACDAYPLALSSRQLHAALAHGSVVTQRQTPHEFIAMRGDGRCDDLAIAGLGPTEADVLHDGAMEQRYFLRHHRNGGAQAVLGDAAHRLAVDQDCAGLNVVEALHQVHERGFAGSRRTHDSDLLSGWNVEVEIVQGLAAVLVAKTYGAELDGPAAA
jgi:hypothetical protein